MAKINLPRDEVKLKTIQIIKQCLPEFQDVDINDDTVLNKQQALDSMTFIYVMCQIEGEFDIKIPPRKWNKMITFGDVINAIMSA